MPAWLLELRPSLAPAPETLRPEPGTLMGGGGPPPLFLASPLPSWVLSPAELGVSDAAVGRAPLRSVLGLVPQSCLIKPSGLLPSPPPL